MIMYNTKFKKSKHIKPLEPRFEMGWFKSGEISTSIQSDGDFTVTGKIRKVEMSAMMAEELRGAA